MKSLISWIVANKGAFLALIPIAGAYLAYRLGLRAYFKQREYELVRSRYLENTIDLVSSGVENALSAFRNNWHYSLQVLKQFREGITPMESQEFEKGFVLHGSGNFRIAVAYRLSRLIRDDQAFWEMEQSLFAFLDEANDFFHNDLVAGIKKGIQGELNRPKEEVVELYLARLKEYERESHNYYPLLTEIEALSGFLERECFTFEAIQDFHKKKEVQDSVSRLNAALGKVLAEDKKNSPSYRIHSTADPQGGSPAGDS